MGHHDRRPYASDLTTETGHHPRVDSDSTQDTLWNVELDVGTQSGGLGPEQSEDDMGDPIIGQCVDQGPGVSLRTSRQVVGQNVEDDGRYVAVGHGSVAGPEANIDEGRSGFG
jgi:hypothetical protein